MTCTRRVMLTLALTLAGTLAATAAGPLQAPEQFLGFKVGAENKLARWDKIVDYMKLAAANSDRVRFRELGKTSRNNPFIALEISAPETLKNLDRYKQLERKLYFQGGAPTDSERDEIDGDLVVPGRRGSEEDGVILGLRELESVIGVDEDRAGDRPPLEE